ncbi:MAG TPA: hypothetical protein VK858_12030 [Longimicrobiales bacterium]|nr:hypothetical protein [Longimicrobiales bacterium]
MSTLVIIGTAIGFLLGLVHARGVYLGRVRDAGATPPSAGARLRAAYAALWAIALWTLFGTYVLVLWLVAVPIWAAARALGAPSPLTTEARA